MTEKMEKVLAGLTEPASMPAVAFVVLMVGADGTVRASRHLAATVPGGAVAAVTAATVAEAIEKLAAAAPLPNPGDAVYLVKMADERPSDIDPARLVRTVQIEPATLGRWAHDGRTAFVLTRTRTMVNVDADKVHRTNREADRTVSRWLAVPTAIQGYADGYGYLSARD